jgi:SAM-dependent methyltransferase
VNYYLIGRRNDGKPGNSRPASAGAERCGYVAKVGFYRNQVLPRLVDRTCRIASVRPWRIDTAAGLSGRIVEIGFGSGLNLEYYPEAVDLVYAVEPAPAARRLARRRRPPGIEIVDAGSDAQSLALADDSCDGALSTFTLCVIPDVAAALAELRRVVRPGGRFHFLEHGIAPDATVARWQARLEPLEKRFADGCHLTRDAAVLVAGAGFQIVELERRYAKGPKPWTWFTRGVAVNPKIPGN